MSTEDPIEAHEQELVDGVISRFAKSVGRAPEPEEVFILLAVVASVLTTEGVDKHAIARHNNVATAVNALGVRASYDQAAIEELQAVALPPSSIEYQYDYSEESLDAFAAQWGELYDAEDAA